MRCRDRLKPGLHTWMGFRKLSVLQELALVYWRTDARHPHSEITAQTRLISRSKRSWVGEVIFSTNTRAGTFDTNSIGIAKVKKALNKPRNASSGMRATLKRL